MLIAAQKQLTNPQAALLFCAFALGFGALIWVSSRNWRWVYETFPSPVKKNIPWRRSGLPQIRIDRVTYKDVEVLVLEEGLFISKPGIFSHLSKQILIPWPQFQMISKLEIPLAGMRFGHYSINLQLRNRNVQMDIPLNAIEEAAARGLLVVSE